MRILMAIILLAIAACSDSDNHSDELTKDWVEYQKSGVFSVKHPEGWTVKFDEANGSVKLSNSGKQTAYILPVYSPVRLNEYKASVLLRELASKSEPALFWDLPQPGENNSLVLKGSNKQLSGTAILTWVSNQNSSAAICYIISIHQDYNEKDIDNIIGILSGFRPIILQDNKSIKQKQQPFHYVRWQDPAENSFTVEVPENWQVQGGLVRYTAVDYRRGTYLTSPDNMVNVFFMDPGIPFFVLPDETTRMLGMNEGTYYEVMDGTKMLIRRYASGVNFAQEYVMNRFSNSLSDFSIQKKQNREDIARLVNREFELLNAAGQGFMRLSSTSGEVSFRGKNNSQKYTGYAAATTVLTETHYGGAWEVRQLFGFVAPEAKVSEAAEVMSKLVSSFMWNPQWYMRQNKTNANISDIVSRTGEQMASIINSTFELGQSRIDNSMQAASDYYRGTITLRDENGQQFNVWNTSNYYWVDVFNEVGGTELFENPDVSKFRRLFGSS